jgi:hypothetical protein
MPSTSAIVRLVIAETSEGAIRVLLADDDEAFLEHLLALIERQNEPAVVGTHA